MKTKKLLELFVKNLKNAVDDAAEKQKAYREGVLIKWT